MTLATRYTIGRCLCLFLAIDGAVGATWLFGRFLFNIWIGVFPNNLIGWSIFGGAYAVCLCCSYHYWCEAERCRRWIEMARDAS